ncbi:MAG: PHP domain-containing protein [Vigna little leaf phytoplasma]|nr:PHP domain-containing protein [Vigna little leaf phytoplasma]
MSNKLEEFYTLYKQYDPNKWNFKNVVVQIEKSTWNLCFELIQISPKAKELKDFISQLKNFVLKFTNSFASDNKLKLTHFINNIYFDINNFSAEYLQKVIDDIYHRENQNIEFKIFLKKIKILSLYNDICLIQIDSFFMYLMCFPNHKYCQNFLIYLQHILLCEYGIKLKIKLDKSLQFENSVSLSKEKVVFDYRDINDEETFKQKFLNILDYIIHEDKAKIIFNIFRHSISIIDLKNQICEFEFDTELLQIDKYYNVIVKKTRMLEHILNRQYDWPLKINIKNIKKTNYNSSEFEFQEIIPEITFKDIPYENNEELIDFKKKYPKFKIKGYIQKPEYIKTKGKSLLFSFYLVDPQTKQDSIAYRKFVDISSKEICSVIKKDFHEGILIKIISTLDKYSKKQDFYFNFVGKDENFNQVYEIIDHIPLSEKRNDNFVGPKRIEFHAHTKMSNLNSIVSVKDYIETALRWKHEALAFTDYNGLYAYPEINRFIQNQNIKPILGAEVDYVEEKPIFITNQDENINGNFEDFKLKTHRFVVFDIETTGFSKIHDHIIEISAVKIENGVITKQIFNELINPGEDFRLNSHISELTGIQSEDLINKPSIEVVLPKFLEFIKDHILVAHNAIFDMGFLKEKIKKLNLDFVQPFIIDTLPLAQKYFSKDLKYFSLKRLMKLFKVKPIIEIEGQQHHRALYDANATALVLLEMFKKLEEGVSEDDTTLKKILYFSDLKGKIANIYERSYRLNLLVCNQKGYKNLFILISEALTSDFYKKPRVLKSKLAKYKEGLLIGSGGVEGKLFEVALNQDDLELEKIMEEYDYIEVQPPHSYKHIIYDLGGDDIQNQEKILNQIQKTILKIIYLAKKKNKIVIATGDVYYLHPYEKIYREIYINAKLIGGGLHHLSKYKSEYLPDNYFMTTQEMFDAFHFIKDEQVKKEIIIDNTHLLNQKIEKIQIFPQKLFCLQDNAFAKNLKIPSIKKEMQNLIENKIIDLYGQKVHPIIQDRIDKELTSILGKINDIDVNQTIAPIYYLTHLLVKKSIEDKYPVGSRGSIGSSLIANILEITEVNPLKPHYRCPKCKYTVVQMTNEEKQKNIEYQRYIFTIEQKYNKKDQNNYDNLITVLSGYDLPDCLCPFCVNIYFKKDGQDIPFETFLGFEGKKTPDIDLNFAGNYQSEAHDYIKHLLGVDQVYRAGTIQTVAKQYAFGYVKNFIKEKKLENQIRSCEIYRRANIIEGAKRSTGQHPGGIVIVPSEISIYDVTPIQFPANDINSIWKTTHFDYHSFEKNLFKMDILGHDDPMLIKFFMDYVLKHPKQFTFYRYQDIPIDDKRVYEIFSCSSVQQKSNNKDVISTLAIPEFGTNFVQKMLENIYQKEKKPFNFATLVKVSGLSHGTDVWTQNAQDIINQKGDFKKYNKIISFHEIISCRDEIMSTLIHKKIEPIEAFNIMEFVRKGQQHIELEKWKNLISPLEGKIDSWYLKSLEKIKYLFPKAHATAYVLMAVRIAWFKVHHPLLFYSGYFSKRADQFDYDIMLKKSQEILSYINILEKKITTKSSTTVKEQNLINTLKNAVEMINRGFNFLPIDLNKSDANIFVIDEKHKSLRMPFITLDGLGQIAAEKIVKARQDKLFTSKQDFLARVKVNKTILKKFEELSLFNYFI